MMEVVIYGVLVVQMVILILQFLMLYRAAYKSTKTSQTTPSDAVLIKSIIDDFTSKLALRDEKIAELMVRLEVLEERMKIKSSEVVSAKQKAEIEMSRKPSISHDVVYQILTLLSKKSMTSIEVQKVVKRSREHVARLLKTLYEQGLVTRDTRKRPFKYSITEKGEEILTSSL